MAVTEDRTVNELILDALIMRQVHLLRYSTGVSRRVTAILDSSEIEVGRLIRDELRDIPEGITHVDSQGWQTVLALADRITTLRRAAWTQTRDAVMVDMDALTEAQALFLVDAYGFNLPVDFTFALPVVVQLRSIVRSKPMEGLTIQQWFDHMAQNDNRRIRAALFAGANAGESGSTIARRVLGTQRVAGADGATQAARRDLGSITRTAVQHTATVVQQGFTAVNSEVLLETEQFAAVLDGNTTRLCRSLDGKRYPRGLGPYPPLHIMCRSIRFAVINGAVISGRPIRGTINGQWIKLFGRELGKPNIQDEFSLPESYKLGYEKWAKRRAARLIGGFPEPEVYAAWLRKQPAATQNDILGITRAKLFRKGELELGKFVDLNGRELTLAELAKRAPEAFRKAGLNPRNF